jgi:hypothetical protein
MVCAIQEQPRRKFRLPFFMCFQSIANLQTWDQRSSRCYALRLQVTLEFQKCD